MAEPVLRRHDLLYITPGAWAAFLESPAGRGHPKLLADGAARGWPLVARRRTAEDRPGSIAAGLPLPPAAGKARLAWSLMSREVDRIAPPLPLAQAISAAPLGWRETLHALVAIGANAGLVPRVFGSLAWAALTGLDYLGPRSDLDLLWPIRDSRDLAPLLRSLSEIDRGSPMRLDGEIVWPDGRAVNWRELAWGADEVLVKTLDRVQLATVRDLLRTSIAA